MIVVRVAALYGSERAGAVNPCDRGVCWSFEPDTKSPPLVSIFSRGSDCTFLRRLFDVVQIDSHTLMRCRSGNIDQAGALCKSPAVTGALPPVAAGGRRASGGAPPLLGGAPRRLRAVAAVARRRRRQERRLMIVLRRTRPTSTKINVYLIVEKASLSLSLSLL